MQVTELYLYLLALLHLAPATWSVYHILLYKRDTRAALGWIMASIFIPYGGPVAYFFFGINRVRSRARGIRGQFFATRHQVGDTCGAASPEIGRGLESVGHRITGKSLSIGNAIEVFHNGEQAYPAMLDSIERAQHRVLLSTFILKSDQTGQAFADALSDAAARGVDVMVIVDGVGDYYSRPRPSKMLRKRGVNVVRFLPPRLLPPSIYLNLRNHRKLLIVDQDIAYAGGMNIGDDHTSVAGQAREITDVHFSLRGPVIADLASVFNDDWLFTTGSRIEAGVGPAPVGEARCRVIPDGPDDQIDTLALNIQGAVSTARTSLDIMTPYFLPSRELVASFQSAALRGVRVRVVLPAKNNLIFVHWANRNLLAELIELGIEAYYQPAPFCHSKLFCIDDEYSLISSANIDPRSLRLNFEIGVEVFSRPLNLQLRTHIDEVIAASEPISSQSLSARSTAVRLRDSMLSLFSPYM